MQDRRNASCVRRHDDRPDPSASRASGVAILPALIAVLVAAACLVGTASADPAPVAGPVSLPAPPSVSVPLPAAADPHAVVPADGNVGTLLRDLAIILALVVANGFFVAAEFAFVKVRAARIDALAEEGRPSAKAAAHVLDNVDAYLSACQLGITLASLGLGWAGEPFVAGWIAPLLEPLGLTGLPATAVIASTLAFVIITFLHIVVGEMAPKSLAIRQAERIALLTARPLRWFNALLFPFIWVLNGAAVALLRLVGIPAGNDADDVHTEDDIRVILAHSARHGHLSRRERVLMEKILDFPDKLVRQIMVPRTSMVVLRADRTLAENLRTAAESGHSRFPVCKPGSDEVLGFVIIREMYAARDRGVTDVCKVLRKALFLPENCRLERVLTAFQRSRRHMAIIIDEYGATAGLVTLEDVLEEIVGEIQDEGDTEQPRIRSIRRGVWIVEGLCPLADFETAMGLDLGELADSSDTVAGLVLTLAGEEPRVGLETAWQGHRFRVEAVEGRRISKLRFTRADAGRAGATSGVSPVPDARGAGREGPDAGTPAADGAGRPASSRDGARGDGGGTDSMTGLPVVARGEADAPVGEDSVDQLLKAGGLRRGE